MDDIKNPPLGSRVVITPNGLEVQTYDREENDAIIKKIMIKYAKTMKKLADYDKGFLDES